MAELTNIPKKSKLAINRAPVFSEKDKRLMHVALDEVIIDHADATDPHPQYATKVDFYTTGIDDNAVEEVMVLSGGSSFPTLAGMELTLGGSEAVAGSTIRRPNDTGALYVCGGSDTNLANGGYITLAGASSIVNQNAVVVHGNFKLEERAAEGATWTGQGQIWVKNTTPQELWFTDEAGTSTQLGVGGGGFTSPLTTKGDILGYTTTDARVPVGTDGYVLSANSTEATGLEWITAPVTGLENVVEDTTPQLGGNLDVNSNSIVSVSGGDIAITPDTTGDVILDGLKYPQADGTTGQVLQTNGAAQLSWATIAAGSSPSTGYGEISVEGSATTTTFAGTSTDFTNKVQVTVFDTNGVSSSGITPDHTNDHLTVANAGPYILQAHVSFSGGSNDTISMAIFINNGATQVGERVTRKLGTGGDVGAVGLFQLADLSASDTVELWVQNESSTAAITVQDAGLHVAGLTGLGAIVEDTTPQLGGSLDVNGNSIVSVSAGDISITPDTTGDLILDGLKWPQADGTANYVLETDGAGQLSWVAQAGGGTTTFKGLTDTPSTYVGQASKWLKMNGSATQLEFTTSPVTSTSVVAPLVKSGTTTPQYSIPAAAGPSTNGYMTGADKAKLDTVSADADETANVLVEGNGITITGSTVSLDYTASTSAPTGTPADGELWFRYTA